MYMDTRDFSYLLLYCLIIVSIEDTPLTKNWKPLSLRGNSRITFDTWERSSYVDFEWISYFQ